MLMNNSLHKYMSHEINVFKMFASFASDLQERKIVKF